MKNLQVIKHELRQMSAMVFSVILLTLFTLISVAQESGPGQGTSRPSQAQQANDYLHSFEKDPNGVPNNAAWYAQPWIWAIVAAILIVIIGHFARNYGRNEHPESESGTSNGV
jgi:hypothetical protein